MRRTTQEFQLDDDLGDSSATSLRYGGKMTYGVYRKAGSVWVRANTLVKVWVYADADRQAELAVLEPDAKGTKSETSGKKTKVGKVGATSPMYIEFKAGREGYHQLSAKLTKKSDPVRGYIKVEYEAPAVSSKF